MSINKMNHIFKISVIATGTETKQKFLLNSHLVKDSIKNTQHYNINRLSASILQSTFMVKPKQYVPDMLLCLNHSLGLTSKSQQVVLYLQSY